MVHVYTDREENARLRQTLVIRSPSGWATSSYPNDDPAYDSEHDHITSEEQEPLDLLSVPLSADLDGSHVCGRDTADMAEDHEYHSTQPLNLYASLKRRGMSVARLFGPRHPLTEEIKKENTMRAFTTSEIGE